MRAGLGAPLLYADEAAYLRVIEEQIETVKMPYREIRTRGLDGKQPGIPRYAVITDLLAQIYPRVRVSCDVGQASIGLTQAFLALQAYRNRHGAYPECLADVEKSLGLELREDPFSGKPFVYDLKDDDFTLYSIGPNLKDDGGTPSESPHETGDIVWGNPTPDDESAQNAPPPSNS